MRCRSAERARFPVKKHVPFRTVFPSRLSEQRPQEAVSSGLLCSNHRLLPPRAIRFGGGSFACHAEQSAPVGVLPFAEFVVCGVCLNASDRVILIPHFPPYGGKVP